MFKFRHLKHPDDRGPLKVMFVITSMPVGGAETLLVAPLGVVLAAELMNTALELIVDRLHPESDPGIGMAKGQGLLPTFIAPEAKVPMISTLDIGRTGAERLLAGGSGKRIVELAGPEEYSPNDVALAVGQMLGKPVAAQHAPLSAVVPTFTSFGFSAEAAALFEEMYAGFAKGAIGYEYPEQLVRGTVTLAEGLRRMA